MNRRLGSQAAIYEVTVALLGWGALLWLTRLAHQPLKLWPILLFALLAVALKREGFRVARLVTHSLAGVAVLAAMIALGPCSGGWVAALSGSFFLASRPPRDEQLPGPARWRLPLFGGGLNALVVLAGASLYSAAGGRWAPETLTWRDLLPAIVLSLTWFLGDHLGWCARIGLEEGRAGLQRFLRTIHLYSMAVELLPLPLAAVLAVTYRALGGPAFAIWSVFLLAVGEVLRHLNRALNRASQRVADLTTLNAFSQALLASKLDVTELCELLRIHTAAVVDARHFWLGLFDQRGKGLQPVLSRSADGSASEADPAPAPELAAWMQKHRAPLLIRDGWRERLPFDGVGREGAFRSGLFIPLQATDGLSGLLAVQSPEPNAYSDDDLRTVVTFANQTAVAILNARSYEAEQRRARQLATVGEVSRRVVAILGMDRLFSEVVDLIRDAFGYYHVQLFTVDPASDGPAFRASTSPLIQAQGLQVAPGQGLIGWVAETGEQVVVDDVAAQPRYRLVEGLQETRSEVVLPLKVDERLVGILDVMSDRPAAFGEEDLSVLQTLADQVAVAIENARLYTAQQEEAWVSTALLQVAEALANLIGLDEVLDAVIRLVPLLVGVDRCFLFVREEGAGALRVARVHGPTGSEQEAFLARTLAELAPAQELATNTGPANPDAGQAEPAREALVRLGLGSGLALPLRAGGETVGLLVAGDVEPVALNRNRRAILTGIANQAAMAIRNAHLYIAQRQEAWVSTALLQVAELTGRTRDLDEILAGLVRLTPMLVGVERCCVFLWDRNERRYVATQGHGLRGEDKEGFIGQAYLVKEFPLLDRVRETGERLVVEGAAASGLVPPGLAEALGMASVLALPLRSQAEVLGIMLVDYPGESQRFPQQRIDLLSGIANQAAIAIENVQLYRESLERERIAQELRLAHRIQAAFLPEACPSLPGWSIAATSRPAREVGGDFYDFIPLGSNRLGLVIADVSDKGVPAALFMAVSRTVMRAVAVEGHSPAVALGRANDLLLADSRSGMFVTLFYGLLNHETGEMAFANAGHNPPYWYRGQDGELVRVASPGVALGVVEDPVFEEGRIFLQRGDALILYTDGVSDSLDQSQREFGEAGLQAAIRAAGMQPAPRLVAAINQAVESFAGGAPQFDDYTLLVVTRDT